MLRCSKTALNNSGPGLWARQCLSTISLTWIILMFSAFTLTQSVQLFSNLLMWLLVFKKCSSFVFLKKKDDFCSKSHSPLHVDKALFQIPWSYLALSLTCSPWFSESRMSSVNFSNFSMEQSSALSSLIVIRLWQSHITFVLKNNQYVISIVSKSPPAAKKILFLCQSGMWSALKSGGHSNFCLR